MSDRIAIIVIPAAQRTAANAACALIDPEQTNTFRAGLHATGGWPPDHYWCNWTVTQAQWDDLAALFGGSPNDYGATMYDGEVYTPAQVLAAEGLKIATPPED